jgi:CRP-like cAMP-binding protein
MATLAEVREAAARMFSTGQPLVALRLYDAIVAAAPLDVAARIRVADCLLALGEAGGAERVYRAAHRYALRAGHPLQALVCARLVQAHGGDVEDLLAALVQTYGESSPRLGKLAARVAPPPPGALIAVPDLHQAPSPTLLTAAAARAAQATDAFDQWPEALHPIPLLSELSEAAFRRVLDTLLLRRLPTESLVFQQGDPGTSFFFIASGEVLVFSTDDAGAQTEIARLRENAIFGEMALVSAQPRSASVRTVGEVDLLEIGRQSLAALADEVAAVAHALHTFTRDRLLGNLMARSPLFRLFDQQQQRELLRRFTSHDVGPGAVIIRQGEPGTGLFLVLTGELTVTRQGAGGAAQALGALRTGDLFGEIAMVRGGVTSATVTAIGHATVLFLAREYVERMTSAFPQLLRYLETLAVEREVANQLA